MVLELEARREGKPKAHQEMMAEMRAWNQRMKEGGKGEAMRIQVKDVLRRVKRRMKGQAQSKIQKEMNARINVAG